MSRQHMKESFQFNERLVLLASHLLVAGMMVCLAVAVRNLIMRILPGWEGGYIPWLALLASAEAQYSRRLVRRESDLLTSAIVYRLVEWVVIGMLIKLYLVASSGLSLFLPEMLSWGEDFFIHFFDAEYTLSLSLAFIIWYLSGNFAGQLMELEGDLFLLEADVEVGIFSDRTAVRRGLAVRTLSIGMLMIFITALLRWDYQNLWGNRPVPTYSLSYVLLYFILGMTMLTLAHFFARRATWALDRIPISRDMARSWLIYGLLFLMGVSLLAFILPTGYSMGLLTLLGYLFNLLGELVYLIFYLLSLPLTYLIRLLSRSSEIPEVVDPIPPPEFSSPPVTPHAPAELPWLGLLRSIVFWAIFLAIVVYAFRIFIEQNEGILKRLRSLPGWRYLAALWRWLKVSLKRAEHQVRSTIKGSLQRLSRLGAGVSVRPPGGLLHLRSLTPRQKVLFFYLAMLRRGQESGLPRQPSQTPYEYVQKMGEDLPEVDEELNVLTGAFVEARYSRHTITPESASRVRRYWGRIKHALRHRQKQKANHSESE
jgi:hypothetical protein